MGERSIVISDIHGRLKQFVDLLDRVGYRRGDDHLYFLGDSSDRGPDGKGVISLLRELSEYQKVHIIGGNHDDMFVNWADDNDFTKNPFTSTKNGGSTTLTSYYPTFKQGDNESNVRSFIIENHKEDIEFLRSLPYYHVDDNHIFVHAGIDYTKSDWRETSYHDFRWIREPFYNNVNPLNKTIVFGHTPTAILRGEGSNDSSIFFGNKIIGIDGGQLPHEQLNALIIENNNYTAVFVKNEPSVAETINS